MKVAVKEVGKIKRELSIEVPKETVSAKLNSVYSDINKNAKVKGFRPGKVPRNILESKYAQAAQQEMIQQVVPEAYQKGIESENLMPIDMPEIKDVDFKDGVVFFKAVLELKPDVVIKEKDYKAIKVKRKSSKVTEEDVNQTLDYFKQAQGNKDVKFDDEFAKGLGYPSLDEFKKSLERQIESDKDRQNKIDVENQVAEHLLKKAKLETPESLATKQFQQRMNEMKQRLTHQGLSGEDLEKKVAEFEKDLKEGSERDVKLFLIMDKIAQEEKIEVENGQYLVPKVMEFLLKEAKWEDVK